MDWPHWGNRAAISGRINVALAVSGKKISTTVCDVFVAYQCCALRPSTLVQHCMGPGTVHHIASYLAQVAPFLHVCSWCTVHCL